MLFAILQYFRYFVKAQSNLYVHSPFVFGFCNDILKSENIETPFIDSLCKIYAQDQTQIKRVDNGAASMHKIKTISDLYKNASIPSKYGQILTKIISKYKSKNVLELGTSLGVSTVYLSHFADNVLTIDKDVDIQKIAQNSLVKNKNIQFVTADFDEKLKNIITSNKVFDLIFIDGNHQEDATIRYFEILLTKTTSSSIFIFDDIYWSEGMMNAWSVIKANPKVKISIDLYRMGIVFFNEGIKEKQDFVLMY
jgi:predicted O-methyltransferase YrrM